MHGERANTVHLIPRSGSSKSQQRNQSLERGIALLRALAERPDGGTAPELAGTTDLPRTTVARLLATLQSLGVVEREGPRRWILGPELARLGRVADPFRALRDRAREPMQSVSAALQESAMVIAVFQTWETETILQVNAPTLVGTTNWLGQRRAGFLHAAASGKLALAAVSDEEALEVAEPLAPLTPNTLTTPTELARELRQVRRRGWATTVDELEIGLTAVAVPLNDPRVAAAAGAQMLSLGVSGPSVRLPVEKHVEIAALLQRTAESLSRE